MQVYRFMLKNPSLLSVPFEWKVQVMVLTLDQGAVASGSRGFRLQALLEFGRFREDL